MGQQEEQQQTYKEKLITKLDGQTRILVRLERDMSAVKRQLGSIESRLVKQPQKVKSESVWHVQQQLEAVQELIAEFKADHRKEFTKGRDKHPDIYKKLDALKKREQELTQKKAGVSL